MARLSEHGIRLSSVRISAHVSHAQDEVWDTLDGLWQRELVKLISLSLPDESLLPEQQLYQSHLAFQRGGRTHR